MVASTELHVSLKNEAQANNNYDAPTTEHGHVFGGMTTTEHSIRPTMQFNT